VITSIVPSVVYGSIYTLEAYQFMYFIVSVVSHMARLDSLRLEFIDAKITLLALSIAELSLMDVVELVEYCKDTKSKVESAVSLISQVLVVSVLAKDICNKARSVSEG
jgi:hypothetical protein